MITKANEKYRPFPAIPMETREWPNRTITQAPRWCSVDLRDGNQALPQPMGQERKQRLWDTLIEAGFKEIEVGFPSASQTDFDFVRDLIDQNKIPEGVVVQVLTQAREHLIERTFEALKGVKHAVVHLYNSTSTLQRRVVFKMDQAGIKQLAVDGTRMVREAAERFPETKWTLEYSPESFTGTELEYALEVCEAVMDEWGPTPDNPLIINLPATVEMSTPNIYADQIEWMSKRISRRDCVVISVHPHNDRGTAVAAAELGLLAGADRIEGTLFGNGERTGNVDIITLALNMHTQGVDSELNLPNIDALVEASEYCTRIPVHPRHPYAGNLVFTAFSGSHQDAIKKGLAVREEKNEKIWEVPYLPIDPADVGRSYEAIIRVNSQSGKGGVAFLLEQDYGLKLPRKLQVEFSRAIQRVTDASEKDLSSTEIWQVFEEEYLNRDDRLYVADSDIELRKGEGGLRSLSINLGRLGKVARYEEAGNGPIDALSKLLTKIGEAEVEVVNYSEHAVGKGADAKAVAYVEVTAPNGQTLFGVGIHSSILTASLRAVVGACNRVAKLS